MTSLAVAVGATTTTWLVDNDDIIAGLNYPIRLVCEDEAIEVVGAEYVTFNATERTSWTVRRGVDGTTPAAHAGLTPVTSGAVTTGGGGAGNVTVLLTGAETAVGNFFRGPDDPADTPAYLAILAPGDLWVDTATITGTGTFPVLYANKQRNAANDGWNFTPLVAVDPEGNLVALVFVDLSGSITANIIDPDGNTRLSLLMDSTILSVTLISYDATGTPKAGFTFGEDGTFTMIATALSVVGLPTANPGAGLWWNDAGTVKVGT